jgi:hypothetical protein
MLSMMWRLLTTLFVLLTCPLALDAQPRPGAFSTLTVTVAGPNTLNVGCAVGSTTCTGGIDAGSIVLSSTGAASIDTEGGITAGSGNVGIINTAGKIPAISSTYFADLSGANITGLSETQISDGSILARVGSTETITGAWTVTNSDFRLSAASVNFRITETDQAADTKQWLIRSAASVFELLAVNDAESAGTAALSITRSTTTPQRLSLNVGLTAPNVVAATINSTDDWNPAGLSTAFVLDITPNGAAIALTGIQAGQNGDLKYLCNRAAVGSGHTITISGGVTASSPANRFETGVALNPEACVPIRYNGTTSRWRAMYYF